MKKLLQNIIGFLLFIIAVILISPLTLVNMIFVSKKNHSIDGYFRNTALNIDIWANREFRTLWNTQLRIDGGYEFGRENETISSALGKNERDKTLSKKGKLLVKILDFLDKNHCIKSINNTYGNFRTTDFSE